MTQEEILEDKGFVAWFNNNVSFGSKYMSYDIFKFYLIGTKLTFHTAQEVYEYYKSSVEGWE